MTERPATPAGGQPPDEQPPPPVAGAAAGGPAPPVPEEPGPASPGAPDPDSDTAEETAGEPLDPLAEARAQADEYLQLAQRKQAEFENYRKRMQGQAGQAEARGVARVAKELLAPLDHLGLAIEHAPDAAAREPLESLRAEFLGALERVGVESFDPAGEPFDPTVHEAMTQQQVDGVEAGTVASVYQKGYRIGDTVLRAARVVVAA